MRVALLFLTLSLGLGCLPPPAEPTLVTIEPALLDSAIGGPVLLTGTGFVPLAALDFDRPSATVVQPAVVSAWLTAPGGARVELGEVTWLDAAHVTGVVSTGVAVGVWDVHLLEPRGRELVLTEGLQVLDCTDVDCSLSMDGGVDGGSVACTTLNYRDRDLDGFGAGTASRICGAGWVAVAGDCDDRDALANPLAQEVCNGLDDDCDGMTDEGVCDAGWTAVDSVRGQGDLLTVSSFERGSLWTAGGAKLFVRRGDLGFADVGLGCPASMRALWAEPTGDVEVAGLGTDGGRVSSNQFAGTQCSGERAAGEPIVAMTGFLVDGGAQYVGVSKRGQLYRWERGGVPVESGSTNLATDAEVVDLHGTSPSQLVIVGSTAQGANRRFAVWSSTPGGTWQPEALSSLGDLKGSLRGVWVISPSELIAVGDEGAVLRKSSFGWRTMEADTAAALTAVRAFSYGRFYVTQSDGRVRRYARGDWSDLFRNDAGVRFNDLSGTAEDDLWAVGNGGVIGRGPH